MTHLPLTDVGAEQPALRTPRATRALQTRRGVILGGGLTAGLMGDLLLQYDITGRNATLYFMTVVAGVAWLTRTRDGQGRLHTRAVLAAACLFAFLFSLRSAEILWFFNGLAVVFFVSLAAMPTTTLSVFQLQHARLRDLLKAGIDLLPYLVPGPLRALLMRASPRSVGTRMVFAGVIRALLIATLPLLVLLPLLSAGDPVFAKTIATYANLDVGSMLSHAFLVLFFAWPATGLLTASSGIADVRLPWPEVNARVLNRLDVLTTLGAMNVLFALFLLLQVRVLFGGAAYLHATTGLTVAQYARDGFFTLTAATALTLGVLLALNALFARDRLGSWRVTHMLSLSLVAMLGAVLVSATVRMMLYVQSFGLSLDRVYAFACITWLATVLGWFCFTVLANREHRFLLGSVVTAAATVLALNLASPDKLVMQDAVWRAQHGRTVDLEYLSTQLSADAIPELVSAVVSGAIPLPTVAGTRCYPHSARLLEWASPISDNRVGWTWGQARAHRAVRLNADALRTIACTSGTAPSTP